MDADLFRALNVEDAHGSCLHLWLQCGQWNRALLRAVRVGATRLVRWLCELPREQGVDPGTNDNAAIMGAARAGHLALVRYLCQLPAERGVDPGARYNGPVVVAARSGFLHVVRFLCELPTERGVDPAANDNNAMQWAARNGHVHIVRYLHEGVPEDRGVRVADDDNAAVRHAARFGHVAVVRYLCGLPMACGVDPAARGSAAVVDAVGFGSPALVKCLHELQVARSAGHRVDKSVLAHAWRLAWEHAGEPSRGAIVDYLLRHTAHTAAAADHVRHLLVSTPLNPATTSPQQLHLVRLACTRVLEPAGQAAWFVHPLHAQPLLIRILVATAIATATTCRAAPRAACMVLGVTHAWPPPSAPAGGDGARVAAVAEVLEAVLGDSVVNACVSHWSRGQARRFWRLVRDTCALYVPRGCHLTAEQRGSILAAVRAPLAALSRMPRAWTTELGQLVAVLRCPQRAGLLRLRLLCDAGRAASLMRVRRQPKQLAE